MECPWEAKGGTCGTVCMCESMEALGQFDEWAAKANESEKEEHSETEHGFSSADSRSNQAG
ncbi:hypothetical protein GCM10007416_34240 [Kroppenstedtia guangzhouensis]|uniref:Uncharacterized protein n=1 Tax=Kroppenstedtia guangzhouensis TaxID=1274356 RepID=A0ABQ1H567_9BACL|nr:hypothetical protein GCM10007416_34240 [Kroppenstedtia guangzhouensis]